MALALPRPPALLLALMNARRRRRLPSSPAPQASMVDYTTACVASLPPGMTLAAMLQRHGSHVVHDAPMRELRREGEADEAARWAHLPSAVAARPWGGAG